MKLSNKINHAKVGSANRAHGLRENKRHTYKIKKKKIKSTLKLICKDNDYLTYLQKFSPEEKIKYDTPMKNYKNIIFVDFPETLSLHPHHIKNTLACFQSLNKISSYTINNNQNLYLALQNCKEIHLSAMLILTALLKKTKRLIKGTYKITNHEKWSNQVIAMLNEFGCFEYLKVDSKSIEKIITKTNINIKYKKIKCLDGNIKSGGEKTQEMTEHLNVPTEVKSIIQETFKEIAGNIEHAYPQKYDYVKNNLQTPFEHLFWMMGAYNEDQKELYLGIYDNGRGIVKSMSENKSKLDLVIQSFGTKTNENIIKSVFQPGKKGTSTNDSGRGRGLGVVVPKLLGKNTKNRLNLLTETTFATKDLTGIKYWPNDDIYLQGTFLYFTIYLGDTNYD